MTSITCICEMQLGEKFVSETGVTVVQWWGSWWSYMIVVYVVAWSIFFSKICCLFETKWLIMYDLPASELNYDKGEMKCKTHRNIVICLIWLTRTKEE